MLLPRVLDPKMVVISLLALKWQVFKVEALIFFLFLCSEIEEKTSASTLKTCHFKASRDITTIFGSATLGNNINKWLKVGRHDWPSCMISDNVKKVILLYVYYMGDRLMTKGVYTTAKSAEVIFGWCSLIHFKDRFKYG